MGERDLKTQSGWYWHKSQPDSVTYWDGSAWGRSVPRASLGSVPVFHSETGKELTGNTVTGVPADALPPRNPAFSNSYGQAVSDKNSWPRAILGFIVLIAISSWLFSSCNQTHEPSSTEAGVVCEGFVKNRLKSPSTASFSGTTAYGSGGGTYTATTTVDSQNSFGATLRSTWTCKVAWDKKSEKWQLTAITQK